MIGFTYLCQLLIKILWRPEPDNLALLKSFKSDKTSMPNRERESATGLTAGSERLSQ
jgi:hypothetical protein